MCGELLQALTGGVVAVQDRLQTLERYFGRLHQRCDFVDQSHLFINQASREVGAPERFDFKHRLPYLLRCVDATEDAIAGLVDSVDDPD
ncbi:hypothetical protein D3C87_1589580 [compost metagenome]